MLDEGAVVPVDEVAAVLGVQVVQSEDGWDNIDEAFQRWGYLGLTVLRIGDVSSGVGARRYAELIATYSPDI